MSDNIMSNMNFDKHFETLFGSYNQNNFNLFEKHLEQMNKLLNDKYNFGYPFFKGSYNFNYRNYLQNCELNFESMSDYNCLDYISQLFQCLPNWNNPGTMINIIPPVNLVSLTVATMGNMYNSNFAQDTYAGHLIASELEVSKYISELVGWDWKTTGGLFTFGGKGTNLYATKIGINKSDPEIIKKGISNNIVVFTTKTGHPCHKQVCNWLGVGEEKCIEIKCNLDGTISIEDFEKNFRKHIKLNHKIACINLNGGNTNDLVIDPIDEIKKLVTSLVDEYKLDYIPHIHVDSVIGWVYLFFANYDFASNKLGINRNSIDAIMANTNLAKKFVYADSIGVDFHKTGFCPYNSSLFLTKERSDFNKLTSKRIVMDNVKYGDYNPYDYSLELSRTSTGALSALASIKTLGIQGFQKIIQNMVESIQLFKETLSNKDNILLLNNGSKGFATMFIIIPNGISVPCIERIKNFSKQEISIIQEYNVGFSSFLLKKCLNNQSNVYFTSSRSFCLPNSNIKIGALKAYPASPFLKVEMISDIVSSLFDSIDEYGKLTNNSNSKEIYIIKDDMVYGG